MQQQYGGQDWMNEDTARQLLHHACILQGALLMVEAIHLLQAVLNVRVWVEWIDSASNLADGLSRGGLEDSWTQQQGWLLTEGAQPPWGRLKEAPGRLWRVFSQTLGIE